ncbi:GlcG/HbpS family heme-binding protein [Herbiconiux daphne]|uniref:Heme-binding protein n=1 Tax=Herbiconiux daphne TaxID=2970914 RepID=A0ABT2H480_9MICO|nr:heme-binding protein [Herbiconiux daphne]MCS5734719.1 heme-binding protein [Herbiconiux daphne]
MTAGLVSLESVGLDLARAGVDAAVAESRARELRTCCAIVDAAGHLVAFARMDGAPFQTIDIARAKAFSVAGNLTATHQYWADIADDAWLVHGVRNIDGLSLLGGGIPIRMGDTVVGAVGVSGQSSMSDDQAIAEVAAAAIERLLGSRPSP